MVIAFCISVAIGWVAHKNANAAASLLIKSKTLHIMTVLVVVFAATILGLERILTGEAIATIFGGVIGYVLGSLRAERSATVNTGDSTETEGE